VDDEKKQQIRVVLKDSVKLDKQRMQRINILSTASAMAGRIAHVF